MKILEGSPISPGFASGIAIVYDYEVERKLTLPDRVIRRADVQIGMRSDRRCAGAIQE